MQSERPSDAEYDRYVYLVGLFRELAYEPSRIRDAVPFALQPVLFNSLLVRSNRGSGPRSHVSLGSDADPFEAWAESTAAGLESLWDDEQALYVDNDVIAGEAGGRRARRPASRRCTRACRPGAGRSAWSNDSRAPACRSGTRVGP